jgi:dUTP pyrophosphatase
VGIKVFKKSGRQFTEYSTTAAADMDLSEKLESNLAIQPMERIFVVTNSFIEISIGYEGKIGPGSGQDIKKMVTGINSPVIIDDDYGDEDYVLPVNLSNENFVIEDETGICQMVIAKHKKAYWEHVNALLEYERNSGGFGNTGKNNYENL